MASSLLTHGFFSVSIQWLPNQLAAVLKQVIEVSKHCDPANRSTIEIVDRAEQQLVSLQAEMAAMAEEKS